MANELKKLIREAFSIAYNQHKTSKLNESAEDLKSKMSSGDINKVENVFRTLVANPALASNYGWTPQGSANLVLNPKQFNLLLELIYENTDLDTKSKLFMGLYNDRNKALVNRASQYLTGLKGTNVSTREAVQSLETAWNEMFLGEKTKDGTATKKGFIDAVENYKTQENKRGGTVSNFGAFFMTRLLNSASNALRDEVSKDTPISLDAPSLTTGKSREIGHEEDFGSDTLHSTGVDDTLKQFGGAFDDVEGSNNYDTALPGEEGEGEGENEKDSDSIDDDSEIGSNLGDDIESDDTDPKQKKAHDMIDVLVDSIQEAIDDFRQYMPKATDTQKEGMALLEKVLKTGESNTLEANKISSALKKGNFGKLFINTVDRYLFENGFTNPEGKTMSFRDLGVVSLAKLIKLKNNNYQNVAEIRSLDENVKWVVDSIILESFMKENMRKIMENVYKKLSKLI